MSDDTYNGWPNRETWAIQLHLSNNEGDYNAMREQAEEIVSNASDLLGDGDVRERCWLMVACGLLRDR